MNFSWGLLNKILFFLEYKDTSKVAYVHANALDRQPLVF